LKVLLVNLLAVLNFANVLLNKKRLESKKNVKKRFYSRFTAGFCCAGQLLATAGTCTHLRGQRPDADRLLAVLDHALDLVDGSFHFTLVLAAHHHPVLGCPTCAARLQLRHDPAVLRHLTARARKQRQRKN